MNLTLFNPEDILASIQSTRHAVTRTGNYSDLESILTNQKEYIWGQQRYFNKL